MTESRKNLLDGMGIFFGFLVGTILGYAVGFYLFVITSNIPVNGG